MIITLKLATKPGEKNLNGMIYDNNSYEKMKYSDRVKEMLKTKTLFLKDNYSNYLENNVQLLHTHNLGYVVSWDLNSIDIKIYQQYESEIKELNISDWRAGMEYLGYITTNNNISCEKLINFVLQCIDGSTYNSIKFSNELTPT